MHLALPALASLDYRTLIHAYGSARLSCILQGEEKGPGGLKTLANHTGCQSWCISCRLHRHVCFTHFVYDLTELIVSLPLLLVCYCSPNMNVEEVIFGERTPQWRP